MIGTTWQARTAAALIAGAVGEGLCGLLAITVSDAIGLATIVVAVAVGWRFGPVYGGLGAGFPPVAIAFIPSDDAIGARVSVALFVVLLLGGSAWVVGRVRERYGRPPWPHRPGGSR